MEPLRGEEVLDVLFSPQVQIIDAPHLVAASRQGVAKMTANEAGAAGNQNPHAHPRWLKVLPAASSGENGI